MGTGDWSGTDEACRGHALPPASSADFRMAEKAKKKGVFCFQGFRELGAMPLKALKHHFQFLFRN